MGGRLVRIGVLSAVVLAMACPTTAYAQESNDAAELARRNEAKAQYERGVAAYDKQRYKDAVDYFLAADKLAPSAPLSFNIARAYERLLDDANALRWYRDYMRRAPNAPNAQSVQERITGLSEALAKKGVQQVTVLSTPAGATVSIDAQPLGVTPWTGELSPGKHQLSLSQRGYADDDSEFELSATQPLDIALTLTSRPTPTAAVPTAVVRAPAPDAAPRPHNNRSEARFGAWPYVALGAGAAALGGAVTFELLRRSAEQQAEREPTQIAFQEQVDRMESRQLTARVLLGVGGAALLTSGVLLVLDRSSRGAAPTVGLACLPAACFASGRGSF